jgi:hypothetical protein
VKLKYPHREQHCFGTCECGIVRVCF